MKMRNRKDKTYYMVLVLFLLFSCQKEKKVEQVQLPGRLGSEELIYGSVHTVKLLIYNAIREGDTLVKNNRFKERTDLTLPMGSEALVTFNREGLCVKILGYRFGTSTIGGGTTFEYDEMGRLTTKKYYRGYPFDVNNCKRVFEYEYKRSDGYDVVVETEYIPHYIDPFVPAKGEVLSDQLRQLEYRTETFYNKYGDEIKIYYTQFEIDDDDPKYRRSVVSNLDTIVQPQRTYEKDVLVSGGNGSYIINYDENGKKYETVDNYKKRTTYFYPNGQPKGYDCSWGGTFEEPLGCTHYFNEEGYFLESYNSKAQYSNKDEYGNWTRP